MVSMVMQNQSAPTALVKLAMEAHQKAAKHLEDCAKRVREHGNGPLDAIYDEDLERAFEAFTVACDDLRETRDGYRYTFPHPAAFAR